VPARCRPSGQGLTQLPPLPPTAPTSATQPLTGRLGHILQALRERRRPALIILDTCELAGDAQDWVEKQLLPGLIRDTWLRVVITGQRVPARKDASWAAESSPPVEAMPPGIEDWHEFGKPHKPGLTRDFVRQLHDAARGRASLMSQVLGPA
jgi:hypothetical protein